MVSRISLGDGMPMLFTSGPGSSSLLLPGESLFSAWFAAPEARPAVPVEKFGWQEVAHRLIPSRIKPLNPGVSTIRTSLLQVVSSLLSGCYGRGLLFRLFFL